MMTKTLVAKPHVVTYVFDTSAILAAVFQEAGADKVASLLAEGEHMWSAVNYAELVAKLTERGMPENEILTVLAAFPLAVIPLDHATAHASGLMRAQTKSIGLSLGDRTCLTLAQLRGATAVTADRLWANVEGVQVLLIR